MNLRIALGVPTRRTGKLSVKVGKVGCSCHLAETANDMLSVPACVRLLALGAWCLSSALALEGLGGSGLGSGL